uniref:Uncharacterized protein n=1 Tax=Noctiluca scintillans TaxID=2966 RepID=A7WQC9_NOCSC|nr:unknown [Noctiluca scintillans]
MASSQSSTFCVVSAPTLVAGQGSPNPTERRRRKMLRKQVQKEQKPATATPAKRKPKKLGSVLVARRRGSSGRNIVRRLGLFWTTCRPQALRPLAVCRCRLSAAAGKK